MAGGEGRGQFPLVELRPIGTPGAGGLVVLYVCSRSEVHSLKSVLRSRIGLNADLGPVFFVNADVDSDPEF
jgi:hypothetical protein